MGDIICNSRDVFFRSFFCHPSKSLEPLNIQTEMSKDDSQTDDLPAVIQIMLVLVVLVGLEVN